MFLEFVQETIAKIAKKSVISHVPLHAFMISVNINPDTAVQLIVGVGSSVLALLLMLIRIPQSDYCSKLSTSKNSIVMSFLICSFMMFYTMSQYGSPHIRDWEMFTMLTIYIVVHFSTSLISYSMISLLKTERHKWQNLFMPGLFISAVLAFLLLDVYRSGDILYFWIVCVIALAAFLIQSITYIIHFDRTYKKALQDLENYYDDDESHKIKWVRFCYVITMLTNLFVLVYMGLYWLLDYKMEVAALYTFWYLLYMLYLTSNFLSFLSTHSLVLDAFAHRTLSGEDLLQLIGNRKKSRGSNEAVSSVSPTEADFRKLEKALEKWVEEKHFCEYDKSRDEVAKELGTTREKLHMYFTTRKGVDFKTWRAQLRVEEAKRLLVENRDVSVNIIGELAGFSDRSNFHRQFVRIAGCTPRQWRETHQ